MNTTPLAATQHAAVAPRPDAVGSAASAAYRLRFGGIVRSEWIKLLSLRSIRITLFITVLAGFGLSTLIGFASTTDMPPVSEAGAPNYLLMVSTFATPFLALIFGVLGVFAISSEYSSGMILSTLTAVPKRSPVFIAKGIVLVLVSAITAAVLVLGGSLIALIFTPGAAVGMTTGVYISGALGTIGYLVLVSLFAFGIAGITRSTAGGVAIMVGVIFVLPIGLQVLSMFGWEWVLTTIDLLPISLGNTLSQGVVEVVGSGLNYWQAFGAMGVWAVVPLVAAAVLLQRRDAK